MVLAYSFILVKLIFPAITPKIHNKEFLQKVMKESEDFKRKHLEEEKQ